MRINSFEMHHFLCHRRFSDTLAPESSLYLVCGPNGAGKSALLEGLRWTLGDSMPRDVARKADLQDLILRGERDGHITVDTTEDGKPRRFKLSLKTGNYAGDSPVKLTTAERSAITPSTFLTSDLSTRRSMLFSLGGIAVKIEAVSADLESDGHAPERVRQLHDALRRGFGDAAKRAAELASEARGAWQATTGETYGSVKGADWAPEIPDPPAESSAALRERLEKLRPRLHTARTVLSDLQATDRQAKGAEKVRAAAQRHEELSEEVRLCEARIAALEVQHDDLKRQAASAGGWTSPCPECGTLLESSRAGELHRYEAPEVSPPVAAQKAREAADKLTAERGLLAKARGALAQAAACAEAIKNIPEPVKPEEIEGAEDDVEALTAEIVAVESDLEAATIAERAIRDAADRTERAKRHHADVAAYAALSKAVEALPARYLGAALKHINERLGELTPVFGTPVVIGEDLVPAYGLTPYSLLSESEKWRVELAIGYALAADTIGICLIDRFDVLQPSARGRVLQWMSGQKKVQFIVAATLKEAPNFPASANIQVRWLGPQE